MIVPDYDAIFRFALIIVAIVAVILGIRYVINKKRDNSANSNDLEFEQSKEVLRKGDDKGGR